MLVEENWRVIPGGRELVESATVDVNPVAAFTVIVVAAEPPGATVTLDGAAPNVNEPAVAVTVTESAAALLDAPLVPVIVIG
jgi:hypothetical protein